jgi:ATP-binding cassette subfamily B protein
MANTGASWRDRLARAWGQLPFLGRGLRLIWRAAPRWTLAWAILLILQGVLPVAIVYLTRALVDSLVVVVENWPDQEALSRTLIFIALMAIVLVIREVLRSTSSQVRTAQSELVRDYISGLVHQKSMEIDLAYYDMPEYYDQLYRARMGAGYRSVALLESAGYLVQNSITLTSMLFVLLPYGAWLPFALLVSTLPAFYVVLHHRLRLRQWMIESTAKERRANYYDWLLTLREAAAELRLFLLSDHFQSLYQDLRRELREERLKLGKDQSIAEVLAGGLALIMTGLSMIWMVWQTVQGQATLGDLALFYSAFNQGQNLMRSLLENAGEIYSNSFFLTDLFEFLALQPQVSDPPRPEAMPSQLKQGIRFDHITFAYPGSRRPVLNEFCMKLEAGQITAIVGANGAGKSTLIKILCRFYDPQAGSIFIDAVDLRQFSVEDLRRHITVLFQEPVHFSATARENIALGDLDALRDGERIIEAAQSAGADLPISRLPQGYETLLGRWFKGGADLSVGEWQRLALARAFLRQAPVIILDEPTSAMDPWGEIDWLERFRQLALGKTVLLITHRFTTAAFADMILVMEEGQIVESGSHAELLAAGGRYATSWKVHMQLGD